MTIQKHYGDPTLNLLSSFINVYLFEGRVSGIDHHVDRD